MSNAITYQRDVPLDEEEHKTTPAAVPAPERRTMRPSAVQPAEKSFSQKLMYIAAGLAFFITQGMGMNIVMANIYQLQGEFSGTVAEVAWLSAAYRRPMRPSRLRSSRSASNMACGICGNQHHRLRFCLLPQPFLLRICIPPCRAFR